MKHITISASVPSDGGMTNYRLVDHEVIKGRFTERQLYCIVNSIHQAKENRACLCGLVEYLSKYGPDKRDYICIRMKGK